MPQPDEEQPLREVVVKQVVIGVIMLTVTALAVWVEYAAAEEMGTHSGEAKIRGWWERRRRQAEFEETVRRDLNRVMFEAAMILGAV